MATSKTELINDLRAMLADDEPEKNILNKGKAQYSDAKLEMFLKLSLRDINGTSPQTNYTLEEFDDEQTLLIGAQLYAMLAEGVIQARNQLDYSDAGFSIAMSNKTGIYQGWAQFLAQMYLQGINDYKRSVVASQPGAGFFGIQSEFSTDWGWY